jgi:16S rRNA (guanine(527)-N(7))-methyltransferase RsmG
VIFREAITRDCTHGKLSAGQLEDLQRHYDLLIHWNQRLNLTRITSLDEIVRFHFCESLFLADLLPTGDLRIADIGSGAGFPGIPIAVARRHFCVSLIESHQRKAVFLREVARGLPNVDVVAARAEDVCEKFDWIVTRAVDPAELASLNLAPNAAVLMSADDIRKIPTPFQITPIPGSTNRIVAMFHVKHANINERGEDNCDH